MSCLIKRAVILISKTSYKTTFDKFHKLQLDANAVLWIKILLKYFTKIILSIYIT
jgi:hypothetical protein